MKRLLVAVLVFLAGIQAVSASVIYEDEFDNLNGWQGQISSSTWTTTVTSPCSGFASGFNQNSGGVEEIINHTNSTVGFINITVNITISTAGLDSGEYMKLEYWNGTAWKNLFTQQATQTCAVHANVTGADANDNPNFAIRAIAKDNANAEQIRLDSLKIHGIPLGILNVSLNTPAAGSLTNVGQNSTFIANASIICEGPSDAICGTVSGALRRNSTAGGQPDTNLPSASGSPFFTAESNPQTCGVMAGGEICSPQWTVTASGTIGSKWTLDVAFSSDNADISGNNTANFNINITVPAAVDVSFTLFVPATNATGFGTNQTGSNITNTIIFNTTDPNAKKINATNCAACAPVQNATVAMFRYLNTGNSAINITMNFSQALPANMAVKAAWNDAGYQNSCGATALSATGSCVNVTFGPAVRIANLSANGIIRDVWLWADYSSATVGTDQTSNLTHASIQG